MDDSDARFLLLEELDETKFDLVQGAISIDGGQVAFWGGRGVQHLFLGEGRHFDLTCGVGGADRLHLCGAAADHRVSVKADVLTLRHPSRGTTVTLQASRGPRELVFEEGAVGLGELWRSVRQAGALLDLVGEAAVGNAASVADHAQPRPLPSAGGVPQGALLQIEGAGGVETVYEGGLAGRVCLHGTLAQHRVHAQGKVLVLSRLSEGFREVAYVWGDAGLVFADGSVAQSALLCAIRQGLPWPLPDGEVFSMTPPRITAVALDVDGGDAGWPQAWPSGLFSGCRAGHVLEASVWLDDVVTVEGSPRLQLCVAGRSRAAHFSGGSGTNTLRFVYTVTEEDVAQGLGSETRGQTLTCMGNLDVEVGPVVPTGASIRLLAAPDLSEALARDRPRVPAVSRAVDVALDWRVDIDLEALVEQPF